MTNMDLDELQKKLDAATDASEGTTIHFDALAALERALVLNADDLIRLARIGLEHEAEETP